MRPGPDEIDVSALQAASRREDVVTAMRTFYTEVDDLIARRAATCWNKGQCCRFGQYGHRLYATAMEVAYYLAVSRDGAEVGGADTCPHARDGRCHEREARPLGCRVFHCDPAAQDWQGPMTEDRLAWLRERHQALGISYFYTDWMTILRALADHPAR